MMEISKNLQIIHESLWLKKEQILVISDLHLGYEEYLQQKGILLPKLQINQIIAKLKKFFKQVNPKKIIINGDLKHEFGRVLRQEWKDILHLINFLLENCQELILIKGNHDLILGPIAEKKNVKVVKDYLIKDILIIHGDQLVETETPETTKTKMIIIGHEHPAVSLKEKSKVEKFKCFLKGRWKGQELIVLPSFNPLLEGTDIIKEKLLSPFLTDIADFKVYVVGKEEVFKFGQVKELQILRDG